MNFYVGIIVIALLLVVSMIISARDILKALERSKTDKAEK